MDNNFTPLHQKPLKGHQDRINAILFSPTTNSILYSASSDCTICIWDVRIISSPSASLRLPGEVSAIDVGAGGNLIAASNESSLLFYDLRQLAAGPLGAYADCHTDEITQVAS